MKAVVLLVLLSGFAGSKADACDEYGDYAALLTRYVSADKVDYAAWHESEADRGALDGFVRRLEERRPSEMERDAALAYWINLYNATTLRLVLDHYPVGSIKDIGGLLRSPWKRELVTVEGEKLTLDEIENEILRPRTADPRIHFALNCAALSCPPLRSKPFCADTLDAQLDAATRQSVNDQRFVDDRACAVGEGKLRLSKIFDWYRDDFGEDGLIAFVNQHRADPVPDACEIDFMDYDWKLNAK